MVVSNLKDESWKHTIDKDVKTMRLVQRSFMKLHHPNLEVCFKDQLITFSQSYSNSSMVIIVGGSKYLENVLTSGILRPDRTY